ncbi:MAG: hypothetical protein HC848_07810, partial [Limnobacter sp.]|nr:hypothetical protein [Limnobacter sp.]
MKQTPSLREILEAQNRKNRKPGAATLKPGSSETLRPSAPASASSAFPATKPGAPASAVNKAEGNSGGLNQNRPLGAPRPPGDVREKPEAGKILANGFTESESLLLHESISLAGMEWFDGDKKILAKKNMLEVSFRSGVSEVNRWAVMSFPIIDMNHEIAVEVCLHFLTESFKMAHIMEFSYQIAINMETESLEFLMQLPVTSVTAADLATVIREFFEALSSGIEEELGE